MADKVSGMVISTRWVAAAILMLFANLVPMGILQLYDAVANGYWLAREPAFFQGDTVHLLEWLRLPGDTLFIVGGILPVVYLAIRMFVYRNRGKMPTDQSLTPAYRAGCKGGGCDS